MAQSFRVGKVVDRGVIRLGGGRLITLRCMPQHRIGPSCNFRGEVMYNPPPKGRVLFDGRGRWGSVPIRKQTAAQLARSNARRERNSRKK
jgi:hypothetical protein